MSADLLWILTKRNNAFLKKQKYGDRSAAARFTTEPNNPTNISSYGSSGIVNSGALSVVEEEAKPGFKVLKLTKRDTSKRSFSSITTDLTYHGGKPTKLSAQAAAIIGAGSKKAYTAAALLRFSKLTQLKRLKGGSTRVRSGPRASAKADVDDDDDE